MFLIEEADVKLCRCEGLCAISNSQYIYENHKCHMTRTIQDFLNKKKMESMDLNKARINSTKHSTEKTEM